MSPPPDGDRPTAPSHGGGSAGRRANREGEATARADPETGAKSGAETTARADARIGAALALDAALLVSVPVVLLAVHALVPAGLRGGLALQHGAPDPLAMLTSAYVHADDAHLRGNLAGYAVGALYAYGLSVQADRRPWFRRTFLALVLALPLPVNAASLAAFALRYPAVEPVSRGFSGVVGGFAGFVLVALVGFLRARHGARVARGVGTAVVLLLLLQVDYVYAGRLRFSTAALVLAGLLLLGHGLVGRRPVVSTVRGWLAGTPGDGVVVGLVVVALGVLVANLFPPPAALASGGGFTDVFAHAAGLVLGGLLAAGLGRATRDSDK